MKPNFFLILIAVAGAFAGCNIVNPSEQVPTYIQVDSFTLEPTDPAKTGSLSSDIKSVWVYFNNQAVGAYDLPATVPILTSGPGTVQLIPSVSFSGTSRIQQYPFYEPDTLSIPYKPGEVTKINGVTRYRANANFRWMADFETGNKFIKVNSENPDDTLLLTTMDKSMVFEGNGSGYIRLSSAHPSSEVITESGFTVASGQAYLEINYKCSVPFEIGMQTTPASGQIVYDYLYGLNPSDTWRKAYIGVQDFVTQNKGGQYNLLIRTKLGEGQTDGYVLIDNLKIVSF